ncbi:MAG: lipid-transfer protein [Actinobacteria bacterium]|nr:MAG: lipid-transfer protein [Actinomycetota bacterium]RIK02709.1 MAG: lipid-transfer protein [Acidobacteriota bacterium]
MVRDNTAIVGIGQTEFSRNSGRDELDMACEAIKNAVADAGLAIEDIDGLEAFTLERTSMPAIVSALGIPNLRFTSEISFGGGASGANVLHAAAAVATGVANHVVCYRSLNEASGHRYGRGDGYVGYLSEAPTLHYGYYFPFGFLTPLAWAGMYAKRWMHEYGIDPDQLGWYSVVLRENALRNPKAVFNDRPMTHADYLESPMIVEPLRLFDCCVDTDGAVALVITSAERAKDLKQTPAYILAAAQSCPPEQEIQTSYNRPVMSGLPETWYMGQELFRVAGVGPADIDVAQLYDPFSFGALLQLEELGFCERGESAAFCEGGDRIRPDGQLPLNTSGGLLSEAYIHGYNLIAEGVRQIRGTSTSQVEGAELVLATGGPGVPTSGLILRR